jgi:hypothetical protein
VRIVIQCANTKVPDAPRLRTAAGKPVSFVAQPSQAPQDNSRLFARPDDIAEGEGRTWRAHLAAYNATDSGNPLHLLPAGQLYAHPAYSDLAARFGVQQVYILSAGWGLIRGDFLTPSYDITFSAAANPYKRRKRSDRYADFNQLADNGEPVLFFGGKDYLPLFCDLTRDFKAERTVFYNLTVTPAAPGCRLVRYNTTNPRNWRNWHYACVKDYLAGRIR